MTYHQRFQLKCISKDRFLLRCKLHVNTSSVSFLLLLDIDKIPFEQLSKIVVLKISNLWQKNLVIRCYINVNLFQFMSF